MYKILIPLFAGMFMTATCLNAQVPQNISVPTPVKPLFSPSQAEMPCNNAGTFTLGAFSGQSNDTGLDTIYLCLGDQIQILHNNDSDLTGSPNPATPPGIGWGFYNCPPTIAGDNLQTVLTDPCIIPGSFNGIWVATGQPNGDILFSNNGTLQTAFNMGDPILIHFAPITLDNFAVQGFESAQVGFPPGPCVNVNTGVEFEVVYLNAVNATGIVNNYNGSECIGRFKLEGGYPEFDASATYTTLDISLASDPSIKGLVHNTPSQWKHNAFIFFSAPVAGLYNVTVEDGKSCAHTFQINMSTCDPTDNLTFSFPDAVTPTGTDICIPVTVSNFQNILSANFSIGWDPTVLQYLGVQNANPNIGTFNTSNLNEGTSALGAIGVVLYNQDMIGQPIDIASNETLFEICFTMLAPLGDCSPLNIINFPAFIAIENEMGLSIASTSDSGSICSDFLPFAIDVAIVDSTCNGQARIEVTASGGQTPYDIVYRLLPAGANNQATILASGGMFTTASLPNGNYSVCVTDQNGIGLTLCDTITINVPTLGASLDLAQLPFCNGSSDGTVVANVLLGSTQVPPAGYNFTWTSTSSPVVQNSAIQINLAAGFYAVTVTDPNTNCSATASGTLGQPSLINDASVNISPASCTGVTDGMITYTAVGGTPLAGGSYFYNWTYTALGSSIPVQSDAGQGNPIVLAGKAGGTYNVTITDANGCTLVDQVVLTNAREIEISVLLQNDPSCFGGADGIICTEVIETPATATPAFFFFWTPPGFTQNVDMPTSSCYDDLVAGTYSVFAIDGNGCFDTANIVINQPALLVLDTVSLQNPSCLNQNDGTITILATGGTPGYSYLWSDFIPGTTRQNLLPGPISVTVTDSQGCRDTLNFDLQLPAPPAITAVDSTTVKCGNDGCLSVTAPTGVTFQWTALDGTPVGSTPQVCDLPGGTYVITVLDAMSCSTQDTFSLSSVIPLAFADTIYTEPFCFGFSDGSIGVAVNNGIGTLTYLWNDPQSQIGPILTNVEAGTYTVVVTDTEGCTLSGTFVLNNPPSISLFFTGISATSCSNSCDGAATVVANIATNPPTFSNFTFFWEDGNTDSVRTDLCAGFQTVTTTDDKGCFRIDSVSIGSPAPVCANQQSTVSVSCNGASDGSATLVGGCGNGGPFTYLWQTGATTSTISGQPAGNYTVTVSDVNSCTETFTLEITEPLPLVVTLDTTGAIVCAGDSNGFIVVDAAGGNPGNYTYQWSAGQSSTATLNNIPAGTYGVTVTDTQGCTGELSNIQLFDPPAVIGSYEAWGPLICFGDVTTFYIDTIFGGAGAPFKYSLDFGVQLDPLVPQSLNGGLHVVTYFDRRGCSTSDSFNVIEPFEITVNFNSPVEIELGETYQLLPIIQNAIVTDFEWTPIEYLVNPDTLFPTTFPFNTTTYNLTVFDANGCSGTGQITIEVDPNRNVYIPNIFKPGNPAGINDHFNVFVGLGVTNVNYMRVYDRWGGLVYGRDDFMPDNSNFGDGWDGRYRGDFVNPSVYVYIIEVDFLDGRTLLYRGDVTVIR